MKTKELIEILRQIDPEGDLDVVCQNAAIIGATRLPGAYDGCYHRVVPPAILESGEKVTLHFRTVEDLLWDLPTVDVDLSDLTEPRRSRYREQIEEWRKEVREDR